MDGVDYDAEVDPVVPIPAAGQLTPMQAGVVEQLSNRVRRLVAPNPGPMTGAGTNTYLVGTDDVAVVDAGPAIPEHIDRILAAGAGKITRVVCTHTHPDHSPAASILAGRTQGPHDRCAHRRRPASGHVF